MSAFVHETRPPSVAPPPWESHLQLVRMLRRRRVLAPLLRTLRSLAIVAPASFIPALSVLVATQRHPEFPDVIGKFAAPIEAARKHLQEAQWGIPFRRRELAELTSQLEGLCASTQLDEHDEALAYWTTAALRWAVRTERPMDDALLAALSRLQGANEDVDALIAHASRDARSWLSAMQFLARESRERFAGRAVHKTGPLARRLT